MVLYGVRAFVPPIGRHRLRHARLLQRRTERPPAVLFTPSRGQEMTRSFSSSVASSLQDQSVDTERKSSANHKSQRPSLTIYYNDVYEVKLPPNHRFPMEKYAKVRRMLQSWVQGSPANTDCEFRVSPLASISELTTTHCPDYVQRFLVGDITEQEQRNVGFPWSVQGVERAQSSVGGTVAAARHVCQSLVRKNRSDSTATTAPCAWAAHVAGGTHHAFYDYGEGFCVFSDMAVAANVILNEFPFVKRILLLDLDVHQGNGNAVLFQDNPNVVTVSLHCAANYFSEKQTSDLDIELPDKCNDATYLMTLQHWLGRIKAEEPFDLVLFQAGVDVLQEDRLGRMSLTSRGVQRRNELVYEFCHSTNTPLVITMGGGYPQTGDWAPIIEAHAGVYFQAYQFLGRKSCKEENVNSD